MNGILLILSVIVFSVFVINQYIKYKRFKYVNNLGIVYDKMEMFFVRNNIIMKRDYIEFLKIFKNFTVNPEYLDIQILILQKLATEKRGTLKDDSAWFDKTLKSLGSDFEIIFKEFDENTNQIIKLSFYKPDFIGFMLRQIVKYKVSTGANSFKSFIKDLKFVQENEEAVSYSGMKLSHS
jgi:hypothetical protein